MYEKFKRQIQPFINIYHLLKAKSANLYYGYPSKKIKVIGVTGTDGKTTTTSLIYHILKSAGKKVSMISTVYAKIGEREYDTGLHMTTPDATYVQKLIKKAADAGSEYLVLETTSHALDQNRTAGIFYDVGVITNITHEHLDYHKTFNNYLKAKVKLLLNARIAIINSEDKSFKELKRILKEHCKQFYTYDLKNNPSFFSDLPEFNRYNYLAASTVAFHLGIPKEHIINSLKTFKLPPGRLEVVYKKDFTVIIDFAHTPNSFEKMLPSIKKRYIKSFGRLIHIFGAAGLRDSSKRPLMGEASGKYASLVILTEEDYRTEDPYEIAKQIAYGLIKEGFQLSKKQNIGLNKHKTYAIIIKRAEAIKTAISLARPGDVIVITGKSHEKSLCRGTTEYPWDEKKTVIRALRQRL